MATVRATGAVRGGIGLAAERLGHGPDVLVTTASDHVVLRTPTRPDHFSGNAIHLHEPPTAMQPWLDRHRRTIGAIPGVDRAFVCWEVGADLAETDPRAAVPDDTPADAGVELVSALVWRPDLASRAADRASALAAVEVRDPDDLDIRSGADDKVLSGSRALYLQAGWGTDVDYWRWHSAQELDLLVGRRCDIWVAYAMGIPASRVSLMHDRHGLAIVEDVITHPLHRGRGLASALVVHALRHHLADHPDHAIVIRATADGPARRIYERLGFSTVATDVTVSHPAHR